MTVAFSYVSMTLVVLGEWASVPLLTLLIRKIVILFTSGSYADGPCGVLRADGPCGRQAVLRAGAIRASDERS